MIDAKILEQIVDDVNSDPHAIHAMVKRVGKEPHSWDLSVSNVETRSNRATVVVHMEWDLEQVKRLADQSSAKSAVFRYKWLEAIVERMCRAANKRDYELAVSLEPDCREFGICDQSVLASYANDESVRIPEFLLWAEFRFDIAPIGDVIFPDDQFEPEQRR